MTVKQYIVFPCSRECSRVYVFVCVGSVHVCVFVYVCSQGSQSSHLGVIPQESSRFCFFGTKSLPDMGFIN